MCLDMGQCQCFLLRVWGNVICPEILEKFQVLDLEGMMFGVGTPLLRQPERRGLRLPWWAAPFPSARLLIPSGHGNGACVEHRCRLPRFPAD
jgi:hypothetical protein